MHTKTQINTSVCV